MSAILKLVALRLELVALRRGGLSPARRKPGPSRRRAYRGRDNRWKPCMRSMAVAAATRRIGVLKALGATPAGVVRAFVAQALVPSAAGAMVGTIAGNLLALPVLAETEQLYGSANTTIAWWVTLVVSGGILAVVAVTAWAASLRAARLRTVEALTVGRGADTTGGRSAALARAAGRLAARLPVSRPVGLGAVRPFARPVRAAAILLAIAAGTASVTFALGLGSSLIRIQTAIEQNTADVLIEIPPDEPPTGTGSSAEAAGGTQGPDPAERAPPFRRRQRLRR